MTLSSKLSALIVGLLLTLLAGGYYFYKPAMQTTATMPTMKTDMPRYHSGDLDIGIRLDPAVAQVGDNKIIIDVRDKAGRPLDDITIGAYAQMPAMGAMSAMRAPADLQATGAGRYEGSLKLSMRGEWPLTINISAPQYGNSRMQFDLATDRKGLHIASGGIAAADKKQSGVATDDMTNTTDPVISIDSRRRQMIGLKTARASHRDLRASIRAVAKVAFDERLLSEITLKFDGYVGDLQADYVGSEVSKNQVLFTVYSPALLSAQQDYLESLKRRATPGGERMVLAARRRLALWDMSATEIDALAQRGRTKDYIPIHAPRSGTLIARHISDGGAAKRGQTLFVIADLSRVWIEAQVFEADLDLLNVGMQANITLPYLPGRHYSATVEYIYPYLDEKTRTGSLRLSLANPEGELKPGMYAEVSLQAPLGHVLTVPEEAVIVAGNNRVVFIDLGDGRLQARRIQTGQSAQGYIEVLDGLRLGDSVVTSGNFLIAAETRLKTGIEQW